MKINNRLFLIIGIIGLLISNTHILTAQNHPERYAESSVLASGKWVKIKTADNGIYKLTYDEIKKMGFSDPAKVAVYGYGGWMLSEKITDPYIDDLPEVAIWQNKGSDGTFNSGDYILFYGRGTIQWDANGNHQQHPYANYGSYFLTEKETEPKQIESFNPGASVNISTATEINTFRDYYLHEKELNYFLTTGRQLFGESFESNSSQDFTFSIPGLQGSVAATLSFAAAPATATNAEMSINGENVLNLGISAVNTSSYKKGDLKTGTAYFTPTSETLKVNIAYKSSGKSFLNYIKLEVNRELRFYTEGYTFFRNRSSLDYAVNYKVANASSDCMIWDISSSYEPKRVETTLSGSTMNFYAPKSYELAEYVMINTSKSFLSPEVIGTIKNQDLHALSQTDMVMIVPDVYTQYAEKLADRHRESGLSVHIVDPQWIYNEFSSGVPDGTAYRRFMKMFYDRALSEDEKPRYLLLFGDGVFDNRLLTTPGKQLNGDYYLLTFQTEDSTSESASDTTDDYFGQLDDKGTATGRNIYTNEINVGVGRFPVSSKDQALYAVEKTLNYMDQSEYGNWKNKILFSADNTDDKDTKGAAYCTHAKEADRVAELVESTYMDYINYKVYMDAYPEEDVNGKKTIPGAKNDFLNRLKEGVLICSYTGHGSPTSLSAEDMLNITDIRQMNFENLPLWITGTCSFSWFDAFQASAGEEVFLNKKSGAIALLTTARVAYGSTNEKLFKHFVDAMFTKENGEYPRLGDIIRRGKNALPTDSHKQIFVLLGDPALQLKYPSYDVVLEKINGEEVDDNEEYAFRALDYITLEGSIRDISGSIMTDFNGILESTIFDSKQTRQSTHVDSEGDPYTFTDYPSLVYMGNNEVSEGHFSISFYVPLDISYTRDSGKMNFYAYDEDNDYEAKGYYTNYVFAGTNENADLGNEPPEILEVYLNSTSFRDGDKVNDTPYFVAKVYDEEGINMTGSGIGHDIMIAIDNSAHTTYNLNSYYTPLGNGEGEVKFSIPSLPKGKHTLIFTVWDVLNNSSKETITFVVDSDAKPSLLDITAYPNPARTEVTIDLEHDRPETVLDVELYIYDLMGRTIYNTKDNGATKWGRTYKFPWNLTSNSGFRVNPGVYIYKAIISTQGGKEATKAKKITVLGQ